MTKYIVEVTAKYLVEYEAEPNGKEGAELAEQFIGGYTGDLLKGRNYVDRDINTVLTGMCVVQTSHKRYKKGSLSEDEWYGY